MPYKSKEEQRLYQKQHYQNNKEKIKLQQKEWYENNKEEKRLYDKQYIEKNKEKRNEYNEKNKEKIRLRQKQYYQKNKEKAKEYRENNKEKIALQQKEWRDNNKEKKKEYQEKTKTETPLQYKMKNMISSTKTSDIKNNRYNEEDHITYEFLQEQHTKQDNKCGYCKVIMELTFEKTSNPNQITIERLDNTIGHIKTNCVYACWRCNRFTRDNELECIL